MPFISRGPGLGAVDYPNQGAAVYNPPPSTPRGKRRGREVPPDNFRYRNTKLQRRYNAASN